VIGPGRIHEFTIPGVTNARGVTLEGFTIEALVKYAQTHKRQPGLDGLVDRYKAPKGFPDMNNFRLGPNVDDKIAMDWVLIVGQEPDRGDLFAHGITTQIYWTGNPAHLPRGWHGAVRRSYEHAFVEKVSPNTLVGLFINVEPGHRSEGWGGHIALEMKNLASRLGLTYIVFPLRLPTRYQREYVRMPVDQFAKLTRADGQSLDHWLRLHVRLGAQIIGHCDTSHQHAMHLQDFYSQFGAEKVTATGYHLVQRGDEWFDAFVDVEREFVLINEPCIWVQHTVVPGAAPTPPQRVQWVERLSGLLRPGQLRKRSQQDISDTIYPLW
jgi:hypothetical protein